MHAPQFESGLRNKATYTLEKASGLADVVFTCYTDCKHTSIMSTKASDTKIKLSNYCFISGVAMMACKFVRPLVRVTAKCN